MLPNSSGYLITGWYRRGLGRYRQYYIVSGLYIIELHRESFDSSVNTSCSEFARLPFQFSGIIMDLNFNACLTLLIIGFIFALILARCLMAVVNRGFLLVDYAKIQFADIIPGGKSGGKFGVQDLIGAVAQAAMPAVEAKVQAWLGVAPK